MFDSVTEIDFPFYQGEVSSGAMFGDPRSADFQNDYLGLIDLSDFSDMLGHVRLFHHDRYFGFYGNWILEGPVKKALNLVREKGLGHIIRTFDGCHNIRPSKSGNFTSMHAWGLAVDFNAATNPYTKGSRLITDFPDEFVRCFADAGFESGCLWNSIKDPMHFQLPWTKDWSDSGNPLAPIPYVRVNEKESPGDAGLSDAT